jgi:DNA-binding NtrC family response regulator
VSRPRILVVDDEADISTVLSVTLRRAGFDDKLSSSRRNVVNALFDQIITFCHSALNAAFKDEPDVKSRLETEWDSADKSNDAKAIDRADQAARMR